jgi:hypothetical protein
MGENGESQRNEVLEKFISLLLFALKENYSINYPLDRIVVLSAHTEEKISYHVILPDCGCDDFNDIKYLATQIAERDLNGCYLDLGIYQKNRNFRTIDSYKRGMNNYPIEGGNKLTFMTEFQYNNETIRYKYIEEVKNDAQKFACQVADSLVCNFGVTNSHDFPVIYNKGSIPKMLRMNPYKGDKDPREIFLEKFPELSKCLELGTITDDTWFNFINKGGYHCPLCDREHSSMSPCCYVDKDKVYFTCRRRNGCKPGSLLISLDIISSDKISSDKISSEQLQEQNTMSDGKKEESDDESDDKEEEKVIQSPQYIIIDNDDTDNIRNEESSTISLDDEYCWNDFLKQYNGKHIGNNKPFIQNFRRVCAKIEKGTKSFIIVKLYSSDGPILDFQKYTEFTKILADHKVYIGLGAEKKVITFGQILKDHINTYDNIDFIPWNQDNPFPLNKKKIFNLFTGWKAKRVKEVQLPLIQPILNHIKNIYANESNKEGLEERYQYIISWFADIFQNPDRKSGTALVWVSNEGAGKNIFTDWLIENVIGAEFGSTIAHMEKVTGKFNSLLMNKIFTVLNEVCSESGHQRIDQNIMKALITDKEQIIEKKGQDPITIKHYGHYIFCSNSSVPVLVGDTDRRFAMFQLDNSKTGDTNYFFHLKKYLTKEAADNLYTFFMDFDINNWEPQKFPKSSLKESIQMVKTPSSVQYLQSIDFDFKYVLDIKKLENDFVKLSDAYNHYHSWCVEQGLKPTTSNWFSNHIDKYVLKEVAKITKIILIKCREQI